MKIHSLTDCRCVSGKRCVIILMPSTLSAHAATFLWKGSIKIIVIAADKRWTGITMIMYLLFTIFDTATPRTQTDKFSTIPKGSLKDLPLGICLHLFITDSDSLLLYFYHGDFIVFNINLVIA